MGPSYANLLSPSLVRTESFKDVNESDEIRPDTLIQVVGDGAGIGDHKISSASQFDSDKSLSVGDMLSSSDAKGLQGKRKGHCQTCGKSN